MQGILNSLAQMPWYGWVAIVAILGGVVVKIVKMNSDNSPRPS